MAKETWKRAVCALLATVVSVTLPGCGGGGGGGASTESPAPATPTPTPTPSPSPTPTASTSYACDPAAAEAAAPHTAPYVALADPVDYSTSEVTIERWSLNVDGQPNQLNVAISRPRVSTPIRGIVIVVHGFSPVQTSLPPEAMVDQYWNAQMNQRGYFSVQVALRGNFGSTGARLVDLAALGLLQRYAAGEIPYADLVLAAIRYQAASVIAVLDQMAKDPVYQPHLSSLFLVGASGGANTVLQVSADSPVFKAASKKAVVRLTGLDSRNDTNPDALPGVSEYTARFAKETVSSLWIGGKEDPLTSIGQLACQFKFYDQASGFPNKFFVVPGLGHGGFRDLFTASISTNFKQYMTSRGFDGF